MLSIKSGQTHYKQKSRIFGSQSRLRDSKPHNNALHAFCGIETIELPLRSSHKKSVFEPRPAPSCKHYGKAFIMRLPCKLNNIQYIKNNKKLPKFFFGTVFVVIKKRNLQLLYLIHKMQVLQEVLLRFLDHLWKLNLFCRQLLKEPC